MELSRENEPPVGTWVKDRHGASHRRGASGGWGEPGFMDTGRWLDMWDARGPMVECGPWGRELPSPEEIQDALREKLREHIAHTESDGLQVRDFMEAESIDDLVTELIEKGWHL